MFVINSDGDNDGGDNGGSRHGRGHGGGGAIEEVGDETTEVGRSHGLRCDMGKGWDGRGITNVEVEMAKGGWDVARR